MLEDALKTQVLLQTSHSTAASSQPPMLEDALKIQVLLQGTHREPRGTFTNGELSQIGCSLSQRNVISIPNLSQNKIYLYSKEKAKAKQARAKEKQRQRQNKELLRASFKKQA